MSPHVAGPLLTAAVEAYAWLALRHPACVIGGLAVQRWGEPRLTRDVDLTVLIGFGNEESFVDACLMAFPGRRPDARAFALQYRVLLIAASGVDVDVSLAGIPFEEEVLMRASSFDFAPTISLPTCSAEDLIIYKCVAGRPRDIADIDGIVARQHGSLDISRVRRWLAVFAELKEDETVRELFERSLRAGG